MDAVEAYIAAVEPAVRREDAARLDAIMRRATGFAPRLMGRIIGYGRYDYRYESGHSGTSCAAGFHPQKAQQSLYLMGGGYHDLLPALGKHRHGKACLYITRLANVDETVLEEIIRRSVADLGTRWEILPT